MCCYRAIIWQWYWQWYKDAHEIILKRQTMSGTRRGYRIFWRGGWRPGGTAKGDRPCRQKITIWTHKIFSYKGGWSPLPPPPPPPGSATGNLFTMDFSYHNLPNKSYVYCAFCALIKHKMHSKHTIPKHTTGMPVCCKFPDFRNFDILGKQILCPVFTIIFSWF